MLTVTHYIEFLDSNAEPLLSEELYQPYFINETREFDGKSFKFSPFSIAGDISTDGSESGDYELIAPANALTAPKLWQASEDRFFIRIYTVLLAGARPQHEDGIPTWNELSFLSSTICVCDSFGYADTIPGEEQDFSPATLKLTNPLNFVAGTAPTRRLTTAQVGPLPASGGITF